MGRAGGDSRSVNHLFDASFQDADKTPPQVPNFQDSPNRALRRPRGPHGRPRGAQDLFLSKQLHRRQYPRRSGQPPACRKPGPLRSLLHGRDWHGPAGYPGEQEGWAGGRGKEKGESRTSDDSICSSRQPRGTLDPGKPRRPQGALSGPVSGPCWAPFVQPSIPPFNRPLLRNAPDIRCRVF